MATAEQIMSRLDTIDAARGNWEALWREIARLILPRNDYFNSSRSEGDKNTQLQFDSTGAIALDRFAAAVASMITPGTQTWHGLTVQDDELAENPEVQAYLEECVKILFRVRYSPAANFASQVNETYLSVGAFGTGCLFTDELPGRGIRYRSIHLGEIHIAENHQGQIDTVFRKFKLTARQAKQRFINCPERITEAAAVKPDQKFEFVHAVYPREHVQHGRLDYHGMPIESCYVSVEAMQVIEEGGYRTFPYAVPRYLTGPKEVYGRSPASTVLADIKMVNEMNKTMIRSAHLAVQPPILVSDDGALQAFNLRPNALNFGGLDDQGRPRAAPFNNGARVDFGLEIMDQPRKVINDAFLVSLFQILVESPQMTATEAMLRAQEKGELLAPSMGRMQSDLLGPTIERELDIIGRAGLLPPMPDALAERGGEVHIEYQSPLNRAQRSTEGVAISRTLEALTPLAQIDPTVLDIFDSEEIARVLADINGMPAKTLRTKETLDAMKQARASSQQAQQLLAAAPVAASTAKDLAAAQATAASSPSAVGNIFGGA